MAAEFILQFSFLTKEVTNASKRSTTATAASSNPTHQPGAPARSQTQSASSLSSCSKPKFFKDIKYISLWDGFFDGGIFATIKNTAELFYRFTTSVLLMPIYMASYVPSIVKNIFTGIPIQSDAMRYRAIELDDQRTKELKAFIAKDGRYLRVSDKEVRFVNSIDSILYSMDEFVEQRGMKDTCKVSFTHGLKDYEYKPCTSHDEVVRLCLQEFNANGIFSLSLHGKLSGYTQPHHGWISRYTNAINYHFNETGTLKEAEFFKDQEKYTHFSTVLTERINNLTHEGRPSLIFKDK